MYMLPTTKECKTNTTSRSRPNQRQYSTFHNRTTLRIMERLQNPRSHQPPLGNLRTHRTCPIPNKHTAIQPNPTDSLRNNIRRNDRTSISAFLHRQLRRSRLQSTNMHSNFTALCTLSSIYSTPSKRSFSNITNNIPNNHL